MSKFFSNTLKGDRFIWFVYISLCVVSLVEMFSASSSLVARSNSIHGPIMRHVGFMAFGFICLLFVQLIQFKWLRLIGYLAWAFSIVLLFYTLLFGVEQAGSSRFLELFGFQFQPSEFAKISLVILVADQIERMQRPEYQNKFFWLVIGCIGLTCALIFLENFSTAALLFVTTMCMMFIGEVSWRKLMSVVAMVFGAVAIVLAVAFIIPEDVYRENDNAIIGLFDRAYTWVARFSNFLGSDGESKYVITDSNYQVSHAQIAIARGGFLPHFPGSSVQRNYLPEAFSDYIFAIIVEEGGFFAGVMVIGLYVLLLVRAFKVANKSTSLFCAILVIGISLLIVFQALMHVCVAVDLMPVTGQPLPLVSRGGTSMIVNSIYFGLLINVTRSVMAANGKVDDTSIDSQSVDVKSERIEPMVEVIEESELNKQCGNDDQVVVSVEDVGDKTNV